MDDVCASRRAFQQEAAEEHTMERQRRRFVQLDAKAAADVPRCASTPLKGATTPTPNMKSSRKKARLPRGCVPGLAFGSARKKLGPARFMKPGAGASPPGDSDLGDEWLAASVAHVRELARKTVARTAGKARPSSCESRPGSRGSLASRERGTGSREGRRRRRAELPVATDAVPNGLLMDRLHAATPEEGAKHRRWAWNAKLKEQVREQRKTLSKLKVEKAHREERLAALTEKLAAADAAEAKTVGLVPAADTRLIIVRARFDETVRETVEMARYADTLALMHDRAKDSLDDAKGRAERLQEAFGTLSEEVVQTKQLLLTLEEARAMATKQQVKESKQLMDSSAANSEKTLTLQDRVADIDPEHEDEVEQEVKAVREKRRQQREARKAVKAADAKAKEAMAAASLALTASRRSRVESAIRQIHDATGIDDPEIVFEKFTTFAESTATGKCKAAAVEERVWALREELAHVSAEESKAFLEYNPDKERLASRAKALRPRTSTLQAAQTKLARCRDRAKKQRLNLLVSGSQISSLLEKAREAVGEAPATPAHDVPTKPGTPGTPGTPGWSWAQDEAADDASAEASSSARKEQDGVRCLAALEALLAGLIPSDEDEACRLSYSEADIPWPDSDSSSDDDDSAADQPTSYEMSDYGRLPVRLETVYSRPTPDSSDSDSEDEVTPRGGDGSSFLPSIFHV